jgi:carboxyl-terminal processing protease
MTITEMSCSAYGPRTHSATQSCGVLILLACSTLGQLWTTVHAEVIDLEGTVKAIDATARTITIERKTPKGVKTLELEVNKKAGDLASVKVGDRIAFSYDPDLELVTRLGSGQGKPAQPQDAVYKASPASKGPGEREKELCREFCRVLERDHYLQPRIDKSLVEKMLDAFLGSLDPLKMYLRQSDIDLFKKALPDLPTALKDGDVTLPYSIYRTLAERTQSQLPEVERLIKADHDFTKDESIQVDHDALTWAASDEEAMEKWRKRIKYELLVGKMQGEKESDLQDQLLRRYRGHVNRIKQMSSDELMEALLTALSSSVDGASNYISPESMANFEVGVKMALDGIGAELNEKDGFIRINSLTPGGPAAKDGRLKPNDRIVGISQGNSGVFTDVYGMRLNDCVNLVRGKRGTVVRLKVLPLGSSTPKVIDITRAKVELSPQAVKGEVLEVGRKPDGTPHKIGIIRIPNFYGEAGGSKESVSDARSSSRDCKTLLEGFRLQGIDGVVVDVRGNGGGSFPELISMAGLFIDQGRVVQVKNREGKVDRLDDRDGGRVWAGPLVVLVDELTGGGAEAFAGAIQDHNCGIVVGSESTRGNAAVLNVLAIDQEKKLGVVRLLWQGLYRPTGEGYQKKGVRSDVVLPTVYGHAMKEALRNNGEIAFDRIGGDGFRPSEGDLSDTIREVKKKSEARLANDKGFGEVRKAIEAMDRRMRGKGVPLREADFAKYWKEEQPGSEAAPSRIQEPSLKRDFYLNEVLGIAADLSDELAGK